MNILIAPDKFKGSLTARQVCESVAHAVLEKHPSWTVQQCPMADGGEGTSEILTALSGGKRISAQARDPLFRDMETGYGISPDGTTAFIDTASASGLQLLKPQERNPRLTSTVGTGDLIAHALRSGVKEIIVGCGGSATNDGGIGLANALSVSFLDSDGHELRPIGDSLSRIHSINRDHAMKEIAGCRFILLSDVDNPLTGLDGAAHTFATQKGANPADIEILDRGLEHFARVMEQLGLGAANFPGAGAAGGLPVSAHILLNATLKPGAEFIMKQFNLADQIKQADLVITGEGKLDQQSLHGKVVSGIAAVCRTQQKKLWIICGINELPENQWRSLGADKVIALAPSSSSHEESIKQATQLIRQGIRSFL
jgi:glycerate 2-kinase